MVMIIIPKYCQMQLDQQQQTILSSISSSYPQKLKSSKQSKFKYFFVLFLFLLFIFTSAFNPSIQKLFKNFNSSTKLQNHQFYPTQDQVLTSVSGFGIPMIQSNVTRRIQMGEPSQMERKVRILYVWKTEQKTDNEKEKGICVVSNGINIITNKTIESARILLEQEAVSNWILILDSYDPFADVLWYPFLNNSKLAYSQVNQTLDSQYRWIRQYSNKCGSLMYLQNYFEVNDKAAKRLVEMSNTLKETKNLGVKYFGEVMINGKVQSLKDLREQNLQSFSGKELNKYLFMFSQKLWNLITPLNFCYYAKYTMQEMLILPVLAAVQTQITRHTLTEQQQMHHIQQSQIQFKQFTLKQVNKYQHIVSESVPTIFSRPQDLCFISTPIDPLTADLPNLKLYLSSLSLNPSSKNATIVINLPYSYPATQQLFQCVKYLSSYEEHNIRIRIRSNLSVALAVYESCYVYCPNSSIIVNSRHNIEFERGFIENLSPWLVYKYHFYYVNHYAENSSLMTMKEQLKYEKNRFRQQAMYYETYFKNLQIFKADLFRMMYFWILKSAQIDFYQTEASFVLPLLEMIRLRVGVVQGQKGLYKIRKRVSSLLENRQVDNLKLYYEWTPIPNNEMRPCKYNSLENPAYRKNAPLRIPNIIHQIWLGKSSPTPFQEALQQTLLQKNPNSILKFWKEQNITIENFPLSYALIQRSLEYMRHSTRSYFAPIASLIRYESLYWHGGIYMDYKTEGLKDLRQFRKYELFFIDIDFQPGHYKFPSNVGNGIIGAMKHNYHLHLVLTEIILQENVNYHQFDFPKIVGGYMLRRSLTDQELFTKTGFGFHLFSQKPGTGKANLCAFSGVKQGQKGFEVIEGSTGSVLNIGLPCLIYEESYLMLYKVLGGTWKVKENEKGQISAKNV